MKNHTPMVVCLNCNKLKHKNEFSKYYGFRRITKRWCNSCIENPEPIEVFEEKVDAIRQANVNPFNTLTPADTKYSLQKRKNRERMQAYEDRRFSDEWDHI